MTHSKAAQATEVARELAAWVDELFVGLEQLETTLSSRLVSDFSGEPPHEVNTKTRRALGRDVAQFLDKHPRLDGAGLIFQLSQLKAETAKIEWWVRDAEKINRRDFVLDPDSDRFYDYEYLEWFQGAFHSGTRTVAGPYIDHLGVDDYIMTLAVPCSVGGVRVGVAGIDILMDDVEVELLRILSPISGSAVLSRHNQVLVGNSAQLSSGVRIAVMPSGYSRLPIKVADVDLSLLHPDE